MSACEWITDKETGDLIMRCHDNKERARVPKAVINATISSIDQTNTVIEMLKSDVEKGLNCKTKEEAHE
ncbi:MAG: hypothetical protein HKP55_12915 [Gammaproteobacteria bacterium]|nr:hypothetical protein [Gammaproteobacteria bacterium]